MIDEHRSTDGGNALVARIKQSERDDKARKLASAGRDFVKNNKVVPTQEEHYLQRTQWVNDERQRMASAFVASNLNRTIKQKYSIENTREMQKVRRKRDAIFARTIKDMVSYQGTHRRDSWAIKIVLGARILKFQAAIARKKTLEQDRALIIASDIIAKVCQKFARRYIRNRASDTIQDALQGLRGMAKLKRNVGLIVRHIKVAQRTWRKHRAATAQQVVFRWTLSKTIVKPVLFRWTISKTIVKPVLSRLTLSKTNVKPLFFVTP